MPQNQQVDGEVDAEFAGGGHDRRRINQTVVADPAVEHHVVAHHHVVDSPVGHAAKQAGAMGHQGRAGLDRPAGPQLGHQVHAEANAAGLHERGPGRGVSRRPRNASLRSTISGLPIVE